MGSQQFCLKWNNHQSNMLAVFEQLLSNEAFVDVTLACEGLSLKAHKMVLSACSPFFQALFVENPCKHPIVILKDTRYMDLKAIVEFMYRGEVNVSQDQLSALLKTAETLKVKGLAEVTGENKQGVVPVGSTNGETQGTLTPRASSPPLGKRKRGRPRRRSASDSNRSDSEDQCSAATRVKGAPESPEIIEDGSLSSDRLAVPSPAKVAATSSRSLPAAPSEPSAAKDTVREDSMTVDDATGSPDDVEFEVDASNLMEQSMTTENVRVFSEIQSSTIPDAPHHTGSSQDATSVIPASLPSDISISQTQDIKPNPSSLVPYNDTTTTVVPTPVVPSQQASTSADGSSGGSFFMDSSGVAAIAGPSTYHSDKQPSTPSHDYSLERLLGPAPKRRMIEEQCLSRLKLEVAPSADDYDEDSTAYCIPNDPPGPHARGHTDGFQSKAIELLLENRSLLYDIHQRISSFEAFGQASNGLLIPHTISPLLEQPLSSVEEFTQAEIALKDRNTLRALVDRLALIGGSDMNGAVKHIVDRCLKNSLQAQFSLDGRKGKRAFKISPLCSVIVAAVQKRLSCLGETPTEKEVLARIGKYLAGWSDRDGGRKKRAQQQES